MKQLGMAVALGMGISLVFAGCGKKGEKGATTDAAIIPGAEVVMTADMDAMRASAMYDSVKDLSDKEELAQDNANMAELKKLTTELSEITGLTKDDLVTFTFSMELDNLDLSSEEKVDPSQATLVMAAKLGKALPLAKIEDAINKAAEGEETQPEITRETYQGTEMLIVEDPSNENEPAIYLAMLDSDTMLLAGTDSGIKGALDRIASGKLESASKVLGENGLADAQMAMLFKLPPQMQAQLKEKAAAKLAENPTGMDAKFAKSMQGLKTVTMTMNMADELAIEIAALLASDEDAAQVKTLVDTSVLSMARFILAMMSGGQSMTLTESLATETSPGGIVALKFRISEGDIKILEEAAAKKAAEATGADAGIQLGVE
jgi:hypothetical protein